ncbi:hypothetical protein GUJ93_ZPchr0008g13116 [Zizania palustris]|uniref:Uncharacterized protein n=1 Tax=Zizania palustris TaxID=103762 RepID=A0A8J5UWR3_ZIZPA|nr:hypothetical protein GUJ93_ZPchr0008g13116 [Zizania palustris]
MERRWLRGEEGGAKTNTHAARTAERRRTPVRRGWRSGDGRLCGEDGGAAMEAGTVRTAVRRRRTVERRRRPTR